MDYAAANVEYAVSVFYNSEGGEQTQAHQWLTFAGRCHEAWSFVWELLQCHKGTEVQFFAATTLHTKILRCWNEVPAENHEELKNKILEAILAFRNGPKIVLNRLCISLAAYIMQQGAADLADILRPLSGPENLPVLLEILTVIPEEYTSMTMGAALRSRTQLALQRASPAVLGDMIRHLQSAYEDTPPTEDMIQRWSKVASCVTSWLVLGGDPNDDASVDSIVPDSCLVLCQALLRVVHRVVTCEEELSESGLEACEAALGAVRTSASASNAAALQVARMLLDLTRPILHRPFEHGSNHEDLLSALFTCAVAIGESHTRAVCRAIDREPDTGDSAARELVELLLSCQSAPGYYPVHETRSSLTFGFWYMLQDEVAYLKVTSCDAMFSRLLDVLIDKSRAPDEATLPSDDAELLRMYRQDIADTVMSCWGVLHDACWPIVEAAWLRAGDAEGREAALHVFLALADAASPREDAPPEIARMLHHATEAAATTTNPRLLDTALECLGSYACFLGALSGSDGELTRAALQAAGAALPRAPPRAALALRKLSAECHLHAADLAEQIVQVALTSHSQYVGWVARQLLGAAGSALAAAPDPIAQELLDKLADVLHHNLVAEGEEIKRLGEKCVPRGGLEAAASLVASLSTRRPLAASLLVRLLPTLPALSTHAPQVPLLFALLKQAVCTLMEDCLPVIDQLSQLALQALHTAPYSSGTDVIRLMVLMLGPDWPGAGAVFRACVEVCVCSCLARELSAASDVAEGLFAALTAVTKKRPLYLDSLDHYLQRSVELACLCVPLSEARAARSACNWLAALAASRPQDIRACAPHLAAVVVRCIGGETPRNQVEPLADLLLALNRAPWSEEDRATVGDLAAWLRSALEPEGFPSRHASDEHKRNFIAALVKNKRNRRKVLETVQEFSLVCRGLIGTEYARQTLASRQLVA